MQTKHLATYLNDHLAGAVTAVQLLDHIGHSHADHRAAPLLARVRRDIEADRETLQSIMQRLGVSESPVRKVTGWLSERAATLKLKIDDPVDGVLRIYESIELLCIGIEGKRMLWGSLQTIAPHVDELKSVEFETLIARATEQRDALEPERLNAAVPAFTDTAVSAESPA
jgi:hypothetical protein